MKRIVLKNEPIGGTPITAEIRYILWQLYMENIIPENQPINAEFMNAIHIEELIDNISIEKAKNGSMFIIGNMEAIRERVKKYYEKNK